MEWLGMGIDKRETWRIPDPGLQGDQRRAKEVEWFSKRNTGPIHEARDTKIKVEQNSQNETEGNPGNGRIHSNPKDKMPEHSGLEWR